MQTMVLGVDLGGPVLKRPPGSSPKDYASAETTPEAFESLRLLHVGLRLPVRLLSQCDEHIERIKRMWLIRAKFYPQTGLKPDCLTFCRRPEEKAILCQKFRVTDAIDDNPEVLDFMVGVVPRVYAFAPDPEQLKRFPRVEKQARIVHGWKELVPLLQARIHTA
ncbi:MAG: hypothetical protein WA001_05745 [Patescibacteria group bacterium]